MLCLTTHTFQGFEVRLTLAIFEHPISWMASAAGAIGWRACCLARAMSMPPVAYFLLASNSGALRKQARQGLILPGIVKGAPKPFRSYMKPFSIMLKTSRGTSPTI